MQIELNETEIKMACSGLKARIKRRKDSVKANQKKGRTDMVKKDLTIIRNFENLLSKLECFTT